MWRWCRCILWLSKHIVGKYLRAWWWDWIDETCEEYGCLEDCVSCVLSPGLVLCITSHGDMWHLVLWSCLVYKTSHMSPCIKTSHMSPSHMSPCDLIETCDVWLDRDMSRDMWLDRDMWLICAAMWETVYVQTCVTWCHTTWWCDLMWMLCESWRTYEWVMVQKWMSHGTHISILRMCAMLPSYVWRDSFIRDTWLYKHMHTYIYYIYIYLNIHVNMYLYIYIYIQIWIYMSHSNVRRVSFIRDTLLYIYICIYVYIYICILVYIYTYTNI